MDEDERKLLSVEARLSQLEDAFAIFAVISDAGKASALEGLLREQAERHLMHPDEERRAKFGLQAQAGVRLAERIERQIALARAARR
jgi:hypothetical protein